MSKDTGLSITFADANDDSIQLIREFIAFGWTFNNCGNKFYLPLNDRDEFNWTIENISDDELFSILENKHTLDEMIGISMLWKESNSGGEFLFYRDKLIFSITVNRQILLDSITDVNWYLEKIIPCILKCQMTITHIRFDEVI